jgi:aminomethyltransferase
VKDNTFDTAMIAVQGPLAAAALAPLVAPLDPTTLRNYSAVETKIAGVDGFLSRTGYTGEDGWEITVPADAALAVWSGLLEHGAPHGAIPAGLGCRDTLRLESAMPLYGHELTEAISPFQAGLNFAVDLEERTFPGRDALVALKAEGMQNTPRRVGLLLSGRRVPREHCNVFVGERQVGQVTSGTFSPTLQQPIAIAFVEPASAERGTQVEIDIRGKRETATIVKLPFYKRAK